LTNPAQASPAIRTLRSVPLDPDPGSCRLLAAIDQLAAAAALVVSDYAKGVITPVVARAAIAAARRHRVPVVVDPKQRDFAVYRGATVITPVADFNSDTKADILWRNTSGALAISFMDGATRVSQAFPGTVGWDWTIKSVNQFD
jgi:hypothetical protein